MGKQGIKISSVDVEELLKMLNAALSEEWLAYYQYWIGARLMEGPMRSEVEPELLLHANQELGHALLVVNRIIQLGGTPVINPIEWTKLARCSYDEPSDPYIEVILEATSELFKANTLNLAKRANKQANELNSG